MNTIKEVEIYINGNFYRKQAVESSSYNVTKIIQQILQERDKGLISVTGKLAVEVKPIN